MYGDLPKWLLWEKKMVETQTGRKQNGEAERMNQTILEKVRCMLSNARLGKKFWAEAVTYTCHLINRLPSAAINGKTPIEMWTGKSATDYDSLHVFGSTAYYHVKESKLDPRVKKSLFLGITDGVKGYRFWCPDTRKIVFSRDVELEKVNNDPANIGGTNDEEVLTQEPLQQQDSIAYRRPRREIRKPARFDDIVAYALPIVDDDVPSTYTEAISNPDGVKWKQLDVKTAFLHGDLEEEIYRTQPDGFKKLQEGTFIYLLLYVHDMLIASKSKVGIERLKTQLNLEFEIKDLGEAKKILGMEIWRDRAHDRVSLSQKQYLKKVLQQFGMNEHAKPVSTPLAYHFKLSTQLSPSTNTEQEYMFQVPYSNVVGSLMYEMVCIRFDISQAVSIVSRSTIGYVFTLAGGPISWKSTLQSTVALTTIEAEYVAVTEAVKEAIWLQGMVKTLGLVQEHINVYCDGQSAIHLANNQVYHARTKHIDVRFHFVREIIDEGKICLQKIKTADNPADMMTNVVTATKFEHCLNLINILQV
ncbi:hypothetical protein CXB51_018354 [Gossypium anomalum]|uniref:Integrase catalytic domain-containing protein n=1 Tax=Gossypium anomalum TaxID=47600 RepID=A0A8J6CZG4_9ROSI|nr:hypothetical protein CXB51_018354 [Gossypium anomalum]